MNSFTKILEVVTCEALELTVKPAEVVGEKIREFQRPNQVTKFFSLVP